MMSKIDMKREKNWLKNTPKKLLFIKKKEFEIFKLK